ncbi:MAG: 6,7-dimethyl-8-ribityllumazine synthase [Candidatus Methanofastidiosa archaeon]|nr:6,7-dimethyl-8-ribityllumazine synthase [Candidatus Methanofastidiosa archaeon]
MNLIEGNLSAKGMKVAIIISRFNELFTKKLEEGAIDCLVRHEASLDDIDIVWVPGAFEIPPVAKMLAQKKKHDAVICLGAVIRGDTPHFDYVAAEVSKGIANASMDSMVPIIYGVITTDTLEQAIERAGTKGGNKGFNAALSAIEMANLYKKIG